MTEVKRCSRHLGVNLEGLLRKGRFDIERTWLVGHVLCQHVGQKSQSEPLGDCSLKWLVLEFSVKASGERPSALKLDPYGQLFSLVVQCYGDLEHKVHSLSLCFWVVQCCGGQFHLEVGLPDKIQDSQLNLNVR